MTTNDAEKVECAAGSWPSKINAELVAEAAPAINFLQSHGNVLYWVESRSWDHGRNIIMKRGVDGNVRELLPYPFSNKSKVHEYGGSGYTVDGDEVYFVNAGDQRIYVTSPLRTPEPITSEGSWRFADLSFDPVHSRLIAVCEQFRKGTEPKTFIATIALDQPDHETAIVGNLVSGADFYAYPLISPDYKKMCWIQWSHPQMPWDGTELWLAELNEFGAVANARPVAGGSNEAIMQPKWSPDGKLFYVSDRTNWWNIYRFEESMNFASTCETLPLISMQAEFAGPLWQLGASYYDFLDADNIGCIWNKQGLWHAGIINIMKGKLIQLETGLNFYHNVRCQNGEFFCVAANSFSGERIVRICEKNGSNQFYLPNGSPKSQQLVKKSVITPDNLSQPRQLGFLSGNNQLVHAFFYPPMHSTFRGKDSERPPLIVMCHGGPTGCTTAAFNLKVQYWTNRGFAVADLNYRGSSGFGRNYRESLNGSWGHADIEDTEYLVNYLTSHDLVDPKRCIIRGSSAGGYTVLAALTFTQTFKAGASYYGIGDLKALAEDTHKFESRYLDSLIGPLPRQRNLYHKRSPIHHAERLNCPIIFFQGLNDRVVPPNQAEMMVKVLTKKNIKVGHVTYADEGHGFRQSENIIDSLEKELSFYREVFGLESFNDDVL